MHYHCVKRVQIRSYFWSVFSCIRTRNNSIWTHFTQCIFHPMVHQIKSHIVLYRITIDRLQMVKIFNNTFQSWQSTIWQNCRLKRESSLNSSYFLMPISLLTDGHCVSRNTDNEFPFYIELYQKMLPDHHFQLLNDNFLALVRRILNSSSILSSFSSPIPNLFLKVKKKDLNKLSSIKKTTFKKCSLFFHYRIHAVKCCKDYDFASCATHVKYESKLRLYQSNMQTVKDQVVLPFTCRKEELRTYIY